MRHLNAGRAVWQWRTPVTRPDSPTLRRDFGMRGCIALAVAAGLLLFHFDRAAILAIVMAGASLAISFIAPISWIRAVNGAVDAFASAVGAVVSAIVLTAVYFGFFLPVGVLQRRSPVTRYKNGPDRSAASYWRRHASKSSPERQF